MKLDTLLEEIESLNFTIRLSILSGFNSVLATLERDETIKQFIAELALSSENMHQVFRRILELLSQNPQPEYAHPLDENITGLLYALQKVDAQLAQEAAEKVIETPNLFWARRLAKHILETPVADPK